MGCVFNVRYFIRGPTSAIIYMEIYHVNIPPAHGATFGNTGTQPLPLTQLTSVSSHVSRSQQSSIYEIRQNLAYIFSDRFDDGNTLKVICHHDIPRAGKSQFLSKLLVQSSVKKSTANHTVKREGSCPYDFEEPLAAQQRSANKTPLTWNASSVALAVSRFMDQNFRHSVRNRISITQYTA
jgi:hypothetical protein